MRHAGRSHLSPDVQDVSEAGHLKDLQHCFTDAGQLHGTDFVHLLLCAEQHTKPGRRYICDRFHIKGQVGDLSRKCIDSLFKLRSCDGIEPAVDMQDHGFVFLFCSNYHLSLLLSSFFVIVSLFSPFSRA